jgi:hypothetical protein
MVSTADTITDHGGESNLQIHIAPDFGLNSIIYIIQAGAVGDVFTFWNSHLPIPGMQDRQTNIVPTVATRLQYPRVPCYQHPLCSYFF